MAATGPIRLRDVSGASGISFRLGHGNRTPLNILDTIGHGAALLDADGDGRLDVLLTGPDQVRLYRNLGGWKFQDVTSSSGLRQKGYWQGCAVADVDNDGKPDLYLAAKGTAALYRNLGGGRFQEVTESSGLGVHDANRWNSVAEWLDFDGDVRLDLYVDAYVDLGDHSGLCLNQGVMTGCGPLHYRPQKGVLYHNEGNWRFRATTAGQLGHGKTLGALACAFDAGKRPSLYIANDQMEGDMLQQSPSGRWVENGLNSGTSTGPDGSVQGGMGVTVADYDGDGRLDLFVTTFHQEPDSLYHNEGDGVFRNVAFPSGVGAATTRRVGFGTRFVDLDNDGWPDLAIANGHPQSAIHQVDTTAGYAEHSQILRNMGNGRFTDVTDSAGPDLLRPIVGRALCTGDLDNDGKVDLLISDLEGAPLLLRNESPAANWVRVRLEGRKSNRSGQGAIVTCTAGGRKQTALASTGGSYYSASEPLVHFGLGASTRVEAVHMVWPGGATQTVQDPPINHEVTVRQ